MQDRLTDAPGRAVHDEDLAGPAAARKIADLAKAGDTCFLCTVGMSSQLHARPMTVTEVEADGALWFFTEADSFKNIELDRDPRVTLFFKEGDHGGHLKLDGTAAQVTDKAAIHRLWSPKLRAWFTEGEDDPRIDLLRVDPAGGRILGQPPRRRRHRHQAAVRRADALSASMRACMAS